MMQMMMCKLSLKKSKKKKKKNLNSQLLNSILGWLISFCSLNDINITVKRVFFGGGFQLSSSVM